MTTTPVTKSFFERVSDHGSIEFAFWISIILLILVSFWKYFISNESKQIDWLNLAVEIPVDLCLVVLTLIVTLYVKINLGGGILFLFLTCLVITFCCLLRRKAMENFVPSDKERYKNSFGYMAATVILATAFTIIVYYVIV